jgi:hypothetical protein
VRVKWFAAIIYITTRANHTQLWLWASPWPNGCLQQIAANGFSIPQDVIAILLQGFVRPAYAACEQERQSATLI